MRDLFPSRFVVILVVFVVVTVMCRAHRLMGQVCEKEGDMEKAIVHYNRSVVAPAGIWRV